MATSHEGDHRIPLTDRLTIAMASAPRFCGPVRPKMRPTAAVIDVMPVAAIAEQPTVNGNAIGYGWLRKVFVGPKGGRCRTRSVNPFRAARLVRGRNTNFRLGTDRVTA